MARPRRDPNVAYADVIPFWYAASDLFGQVGFREDPVLVRYLADTPKHAIAFMHRLNSARAALRGETGSHPWDQFIARAAGREITISTRPRFDYGKVTTADGKPIDSERVEARIAGVDPEAGA